VLIFALLEVVANQMVDAETILAEMIVDTTIAQTSFICDTQAA
jgi:hypothetical protein